jgi:SH3-like domain-containing protein
MVVLLIRRLAEKSLLRSMLSLGLCLMLATIALSSGALAEQRTRGKSGLFLPRFVATSEAKANVRRGPGAEYPLLWQYQGLGIPLEIVAEYGNWRQIRDHEGDEGWMHMRLLRSTHRVIVQSGPHAIALKARPDTGASTHAYIGDGALGKVTQCSQGWCEIAIGDYDGWLPRNKLWGLHASDFTED